MSVFWHFAITVSLSLGAAVGAYLMLPALGRMVEVRGLKRCVAWLSRQSDGIFVLMALAYVFVFVGLSALHIFR